MKKYVFTAALVVAASPALAGTSLIERYDGNRDGRVTQDEIDQNRAAWHGEFDKDKSGGLSVAEFEALWLRARREAMVREYQRFDRDGDGKLTLEEYQDPMKTAVADMDKNQDGALTRETLKDRKAR